MDTNGTTDKAQDAAQEIARDLRELQRELRSRANDVRKEVVKQLYAGAETLRREATEAKVSGEAKHSADELARGLEKAAAYLNSRSVEDMGEEAVRVVRKNPMRAVIVAFVVGLLMGMMMRSGDK
ncbi:MAG: hypothetical protein BroJett038_28340 [Chloroflexota bacterium]|jgi:ElaB/YqjD/DUF883 family membrane-anchored ribosome-binding protein|nr:MAG: hypothetical protein BroJett038_28340 [Chloroflexota bacterium]